MRRAGLLASIGAMICLPNRKRALAVSSMRDLVRKRMGAPLMIIISPWRSSKTRFDMRLFLVGGLPHEMQWAPHELWHFAGVLVGYRTRAGDIAPARIAVWSIVT